MKITSSYEMYKTIYPYCYLEKENKKVLKFYLNNCIYFGLLCPSTA